MALNGYLGKILRVDLSKGETTVEDLESASSGLIRKIASFGLPAP